MDKEGEVTPAPAPRPHPLLSLVPLVGMKRPIEDDINGVMTSGRVCGGGREGGIGKEKRDMQPPLICSAFFAVITLNGVQCW